MPRKPYLYADRACSFSNGYPILAHILTTYVNVFLGLSKGPHTGVPITSAIWKDIRNIFFDVIFIQIHSVYDSTSLITAIVISLTNS